MDDFPSLLAQDFGLKPQGKSAPMAHQRSSSVRSSGFGPNSYFSSQSAPIFDDNDHGGEDDKQFDDVLKYSDRQPKDAGAWTGSSATATSSSFDYDAMFKERSAKSSSLSVFDKPIYDEDIFDGLPGIKNVPPETSSTIGSSFPNSSSEFMSSPSSRESAPHSKAAAFDDLLDGFQKKHTGEASKKNLDKNVPPLFDDLLPGFSHSSRSATESYQSNKPFNNLGRTSSGVVEDPFASLHPSPDIIDSSSGFFSDPLNDLENNYESSKSEKLVPTFDDLDSLAKIGKPAPKDSSEVNNRGKFINTTVETDSFPSFDMLRKSKFDSADTHFQAKTTPNNLHDLDESEHESPFPSSYQKFESNAPKPEPVEDVWLTVSEVPLLTEPTKAPPPARPPPPRPPRFSRLSTERKATTDSFSTSTIPSYSNIENLDGYAMGSDKCDDFKENSSEAAVSAAAMKQAMGMAEATFRQMREREYPIPTRTKESSQADQERIEQEKKRERDEEKEREEKLRMQKEMEEKLRMQIERDEKLRIEKEKESDRERERARQAVERATREARERAATEARIRAEKAAVEKAANEARQRAARVAVQRVQAEARERAAAEARDKAERAAAEAKEKAEAEIKADEAKRRAKVEAETKQRNERAAVERAAAEARQRAAAAAAAAASAKANQQRNERTHREETDLESFFTSRASSAPKPRASASDPFFENGWPEANVKTSTTSATNMRKASSTTNIVDDLSSIFGGPSSSGEFQEVEGETEERRKARKERHDRTRERAAKALAEKNERDLQLQREQSERHRIAETIDVEIKRWAAGKEGNLRALLSTLQYALWPECGWQPVSLTDLITAAAVKKVYRKATLCIHPDKVQQKGATLQQKYIAEKVFDMLKEAWNKFNSEELF